MKRILIGMTVLAMVGASCGEQAIALGEWQSRWNAMVEEIHATDVGGITQQECEDALALLRTERPDLSPTPLEDLDPPVETWFTVAESVFFECRFDGTEGALEQLRVIEAEVETVLSLEG